MKLTARDIFYSILLLALSITYFVLPVLDFDLTLYDIRNIYYPFGLFFNDLNIQIDNLNTYVEYGCLFIPILYGLALLSCVLGVRVLSKLFFYIGFIANAFVALIIFLHMSINENNFLYIYLGVLVVAFIVSFFVKKPKQA